MPPGTDELKERFRALFEEHADGLYRLAHWVSGKPDMVDDLVQEAALKGYRSFHRFKPEGNFKAWMSRILTNHYIDRYRKQKRRPFTLDFQELEPPHVEALEPTHFTMEELEGFEEHVDQLVQRAVSGLPEHFRMVFLLFSLAELSYQEIADTLGIALGTVMSRLYRARQLLKKELRAYALEVGYLKEGTS